MTHAEITAKKLGELAMITSALPMRADPSTKALNMKLR